MDELIGQQLGTYTIERMLGRGGMAAVFLAQDASMERQVAIKVLPREFANDTTYVERFRREVKIIARLNHPNIVPVHAFGEEHGWTYIVMAYMPGGTLHGRLRKMGNSIPLETVASYMDQIASGVDYAHSQGVIHRDFKPANVLVGGTGHLSLSDFGIAKMTESTAHMTGTGILGTPAYMAPELANPGGLTKLVDVYAVGATLYEMITGNLPFNADTPMGMLMAHMNTPVPDARYYRSDLPDSVQSVIERAMAKDPTQRYQSAGEIASDLRYALGMAPAGTEVLDEGFTLPATPQPRTPPQVTARPSTQLAQAASGTPKRGLNIGLIAGVGTLLIAALAIGALVLPGMLSPETDASLGSATPPVDTPTETLATGPTARTLLGSAEFKLADSAEFQALAGTGSLGVGAAIKTGSDGVLLLTLAEGVSVEVQPGSVLSVQRIEVEGDTLFVELTQESGTTYHFIGADANGQKRDYIVHTPRGTIKATGTQFWVSESAEGWYYIPTDGTTAFDLNDNGDPASLYVQRADNGDCILVDANSNVSNCQTVPGDLALLTDGSDLIATETPTPVSAAGGGVANPTACKEEYFCSTDPNQKGTLIHVFPNCAIELLPGNTQCAGDLGGGGPQPTVPGCVPGNCGDGGSWCDFVSFCGPPAFTDHYYNCHKYDGCGIECEFAACCGSPCW